MVAKVRWRILPGMIPDRIKDRLEPYIVRVDTYLRACMDSRARIVRVVPSDAAPYYIVEVKSLGRWIPRVLSMTSDLAKAEQWWRRETGRESWPPPATRTPLP
jgi:hypothetical protein